MPKDKKNHNQFTRKAREYVYKPYSNRGKGHLASASGSSCDTESSPRNDWDDVTCPVCMETPHNAVLLRCASHDKGCRPYMCDTSYRHSNCLDQYCKAQQASQKVCLDDGHNVSEALTAVSYDRGSSLLEGDARGASSRSYGESSQTVSYLKGREVAGLLCPLCRGPVQGWEVIKEARDCLNKKSRVCASESCCFSGSYDELRAHARRDHPMARPSDVDPARQSHWRRLERQRELGDVLSVIQSAMPRATFFGDYAVEDEEGYLDSSSRSDYPNDDGRLLSVFLLFQALGPDHSFVLNGRPYSPFRGFVRRYRRSGTSRQGLWGEILHQSRNEEGYMRDRPEEHTRGASFHRQRRYHRRSSG